MDSGTPLDLVDESDVKEYRHLVKPVESIILDTATGESKANKCIDLHLGPLGEDITPYVLKCTPNAL